MKIQRFKQYRSDFLKQIRKEDIDKILAKDPEVLARIEKNARNRWNEFDFYAIEKQLYKNVDEFVKNAVNECVSGNIFAIMVFAVNPRKVSGDQKAQYNYIEEYFSDILRPFGKFSETGNKNLYYYNNKLAVSSKKPLQKLKSIDFSLEYSLLGKTMFGIGTLKVLDDTAKEKGSGGGQDSQITDVVITNEEFIKSTDKNLFTFTVVAGNCFTEKQYRNLIKKFSTDRNKISNTDKFGGVLISRILFWINNTFNLSSLSEEDKKVVSDAKLKLDALGKLLRLNLSVLDLEI